MENVNSCAFVSKINEIKPIEGADKIELALIQGWSCIIPKGQYNVGDLVVVATTDAVIPQEMSDDMNVTNYLRKGGRVRTVKLRGVYSECLIIPLKYVPFKGTYFEGRDMMEITGIHKYEPPVKMVQLASGKKIRYSENPNFEIYHKFPNFKNVPDTFEQDDYVQITRKIHGTNARYGIVKKHKLTLWDKIKKLLFMNDDWIDYEFVVGSHNVEKGSDSQGYYDTNVWFDIEKKYDIKKKLWNFVKKHRKGFINSGIVVYGEIYGAGIQKGYDYGFNDIAFTGFDVKVDNEYMDTDYAKRTIVDELGLPHVEELYVGVWNKEVVEHYVFNNFIGNTKIPHEGVVVKGISGRREKVVKIINPDYLIYSEKHNIGDSH